jgi:RHS repeat-associated protein
LIAESRKAVRSRGARLAAAGVPRYQYVRALDDTWHRLAQPLTIPRATIMPFSNTLGDAPLGALTNGELRYCLSQDTFTNCEGVAWPFQWSAYDRQRGPVLDNWQGTLLEGGRHKSGLDFKRNRLYAQTGRFTQEDPIGLAGGLNLYGFAGGDPVDFSDPFGPCNGLDWSCPIPWTGEDWAAHATNRRS